MVKSGYPMDIADAGMVHQNPYPHTQLILYVTRGSLVILKKIPKASNTNRLQPSRKSNHRLRRPLAFFACNYRSTRMPLFPLPSLLKLSIKLMVRQFMLPSCDELIYVAVMWTFIVIVKLWNSGVTVMWLLGTCVDAKFELYIVMILCNLCWPIMMLFFLYAVCYFDIYNILLLWTFDVNFLWVYPRVFNTHAGAGMV